MECPECQTANPPGAKFCFNCGTALSIKCRECSTALPPGAKFCFNCGTPTGAATDEPVGAPTDSAGDGPQPESETTKPAARPDNLLQRYIPSGLLTKLEAARRSGLMAGERRIVTILFCDVKGSTAAAAGLDPEEWSEIMNGAFEQMIAPIYRYEGTVARLMGDGLLAFFGAPIAHEDDPRRAVLAGLDIVAAAGRYRQETEQRWGLSLDVRVGINTGLVVVGAVGSDLRMEYTALGDAINVAARMEQTAEPGTVQIAEPTYKLVAPLFKVEALGALEIKGKVEPINSYRVLAERDKPGKLRGIAGLRAPLIGRAQPLAELQAAVQRLADGTGQIVSIMGEAGLGKSRLVVELRRSLAAEAPVSPRWLEGRSLSYETTTPFAPFVQLLADYFALDSAAPAATQVAHLAGQIERLLPGQGQTLAPYLATLLDLPLSPEDQERVKYLEPPQLRGQIFRAIGELFEAHLAEEPLILFLDDLHWADLTSLELLRSLLPLVKQAPLLIVVAFRPRQGEPAWSFHQTAAGEYPQRYRPIRLQPLPEEEAQTLISSLLTVDDLPPAVRRDILQKCDGNPFYVEEIIRSLLDSGAIVRENGRWRAAGDVAETRLPDTLIGTITARLDRLNDASRRAAQAAAVLGREFDLAVLADISDEPETLDASMATLEQREIVLEEGRSPQRRYLFKHALTQEAAYRSLLLSNRRELHGRAAGSLAERRPDRPADIARHWVAARQPEAALPYLLQAGQRAARAYAAAEAAGFFGQVLELAGEGSPADVVREAYEGLGSMHVFANDPEAAMDTYRSLLAWGEARQDIPAQISAFNKLAATAGLAMGQFAEADRFLARGNHLAREHQITMGAAEAALVKCRMCTVKADFEGVVRDMGRLVELGQQLGDQEYMAMGLEHVATSLMWLARFDEAEEKAAEALPLLQEVGDREHEADLLAITLPLLAVRRGDLDEAQAYLSQGLALAERIGSVPQLTVGRWLEGQLAQWAGDYERAMHCNRIALDLSLPLEGMMPWLVVSPLSALGMAYLHLSEKFRDEVARFHTHALRLLESPYGSVAAATAWADLGFCALQLDDLEVAADCFEKGLNVPSMPMRFERPRLLSGAAELALVKKEPERALKLARQADDYARRHEMAHIMPQVQLTLGKVLAANDENAQALAALDEAVSRAQALEMAPFVWQAHAAAADLLARLGRSDQAAQRREAARATIQTIAAGLEDDALRRAYLDNTMGQIRT
ncbi:MAG: adenylate/guanylate cyclase domain-containing protein [Candidatus Promineifilaceae bacterium]|nr:adenylate/guanylate cyclase domain-containing protein [Candidatus Promineifilaceae bacterium]